MIWKILHLPFYFVALAVVVIFPVSVVFAVLEGGFRNMFLALAMLGTIPLFLMLLHVARIEHFMLKRLPRTALVMDSANDVVTSILVGIRPFFAHHQLMEVLAAKRTVIDEDIYDLGSRIVGAHRFLARLTVLGFVLIGVGILGIGWASKNP